MYSKFIVPALLGTFLCAPAFAESVEYRLPPEVQPTSQLIKLTLDPGITEFSGSTVLDIDVSTDVERIGIYQVGLNMTSIQLRTASGERALTAEVGEYDINWLSDGATIPAGQYELSIEFDGSYSTDALGMHRTHFEDNDYIFTQMESMYLRRAVPSFDEPAFKIPYTLTISAPEGLTVVANTPVATESSEDGWQHVKFMATKPLSSYLIAYAVGPLDRAAIEGMSVPGYVYVPKGHADSLGYVLKHAPPIVDALEDYFGTDYPFRKLDFIGVPEFAYGAMENAGLVTYRVEYLTLGDDASGATAAWTLGVIAHEVAHMWFGDLVTMEWWNDLWLNESFASWMDELIVAQLYPEFDTNLKLPQASAFAIDQGTTAKPIRKVTRTEADVNDGAYLPYVKGLTLLRMLENYVGADLWQEGVRSYLGKYSWSNATEPDLWAEISTVSGIDVSKIAGSFLNQPGFPLLTVDKDGRVTQARYTRYGLETDELLWTIPLNVKYKKGGEIKEVFYLLDAKSGQIDLPEGADWILPDAGAEGYFRWEVDIDQFYALVNDMDSLEDKEKMALLSNSSALLAARKLSLDDYMLVLTQLLDQSHPRVLLYAVNAVIKIGDSYVNEDNAAAFAQFIDTELGAKFAEVGLETREDDSEPTILLRPRLARLLGQYGSDSKMIAAVSDMADLYLASPDAVDGNLAQEILRVNALNDDGKDYEKYVDAYLNSKDIGQRTTILRAIYFKDPEVILKALDFSISDKVLAGHAAYALGYFPTFLDDHTLIYEWLEQNVDAYQEKIPSSSRAGLPSTLVGRCNEKNLALMEAFFDGRDELYKSSLNRQVENLQACIDSRKHNSGALMEFLAQYDE